MEHILELYLISQNSCKMKHYQIKTFKLDWTLIETINPNNILNEVTFSANINWWQWQLTIQTDYPINTSIYSWWELVKVRLYDENYTNWKQIYYGYISQIIRTQETSRSYFNLVCLWVASLLKNVLFTNGDYTKTASAMITDVLTYFSNNYTAITPWSIDSSSTVAQNFTWDNQNCYDVIDESAKILQNYKWYVDWEWKLNYFSQWTNHILHFWFDIDKITITDTIEELVNRYTSEAWTGATYTYYNNNSIAKYWLRQKYELNSSLNSASTNQAYALKYLNEHYLPKETISITVNTNYSFESINPWDTISVVNTDLSLVNLPINKIQYSPDKCVLTIDKMDTLRWVIE